MKKYIIYSILVILLTSCSKKDSNKNFIARVDDSYLSVNEVDKMIQSRDTHFVNKNIGKSIVTKWVKEEVIYEKAKKEHFDKDLSIKRKVEQYYRSLVIDEYMKYHFQSNVKISNDEIEQYYEENRDNFKLDNKALKISHVFVEDYKDAKTIKSILESYVEEDKKEIFKRYHFNTRLITKGEVVEDLDVELFNKNLSEIVGPIASNYGFHIIQILEKFDKHDYKPLSIVRDNIYQMLLNEKNKSEYIVFTDSIISNADYEIKEKKLEGILKRK